VTFTDPFETVMEEELCDSVKCFPRLAHLNRYISGSVQQNLNINE